MFLLSIIRCCLLIYVLEGKRMDKEIKATFKLDLTELKELLNKASDQVEQLQETLDEIANFKIQFSNREAEEITPQDSDGNLYDFTSQPRTN